MRRVDRSARVIALASGKGGVGRTNIAINLSLGLSRLRRRTMLVDCDLGLANAALMMGLSVNDTIEDVVGGRLSLDEIVIDGPDAVFVVSGDCGGKATRIDLDFRVRLADAFRPHRNSLDYVVLDTPSGAAPETLDLIAAADMILLVVSPEPAAFMDAYATAKMLHLEHGVREIAIVTSMVHGDIAGRDLFRRFRDVAARFLDVDLDYLGAVPRDEAVRSAVMAKRCVVEAYPLAPSAISLTRLARTIDQQSVAASQSGDCFFGMEALLGAQ